MFAALMRWLKRGETTSTTIRTTITLEDIPIWTDLYNDNEQEFIGLLSGMEKSTHYAQDPHINQKVSIYGADITSLAIDGVVRSTDSTLTSTTGISGAISNAAGPKLDELLTTLRGCKEGEAKTTSGFNLPAKYVVHTVGTDDEQSDILESCYQNCLKQMNPTTMKSLAFCGISTGDQGYPIDKAVCVALKTVRVWLEAMKTENKLDEIDRIIFCLFSDEDALFYSIWMQIFFPCECPQKDNIASLEESILLGQENQTQLRALRGYITLTTEPDMITFDDDPDNMRAKMPCGHVMGPESMTDYFRNILEKGDFEFVCPAHKCNQVWEYFLVRHVACLSDEEMCKFEMNLANNNLQRKNGNQRCPGCKTWCFRVEGAGNRVRCQICTRKKRKKFDFCWICLGEWKRFRSSGLCGNVTCDGKDKRIMTLADCPTKRINLCNGCPIIRACPKCGLLIEHEDKCAHVSCRTCRCKFCFICLKEDLNGKPQCNFLGTCTVAPRQTF